MACERRRDLSCRLNDENDCLKETKTRDVASKTMMGLRKIFPGKWISKN